MSTELTGANKVQSKASTDSQVREVNATGAGLAKATFGAAVVAGAILTFIWLPAEYGIDPTGVGKTLGLTEMGKIKTQLLEEAALDEELDQQKAAAADTDNQAIRLKLEEIQSQLATITAALNANSAVDKEQPKASTAAQINQPTDTSTTEIATAEWRDEVSYTLAPGEGTEVKLIMDAGAIAQFDWTANGAVVNHDTHGDGGGQSINYEKGRGIPEQSGELKAAFSGNHGWFWRNRTELDVVLTLRTRGDYKGMVLP